MKNERARSPSSYVPSSGARSIDSIRQAVLLRASRDGDLPMVQILIDAGANVNCADADGLTPLHLAAQGGAVDVCFALLEAGAAVNVASRAGLTPLQSALAQPVVCDALVGLLRSRTSGPSVMSSSAD